jgi:glutamate N-acetyltransferase/amino-acid N-acetyltransferase
MSQTKAALTRVPSFRAVGVTCGLKTSGNPDLALVLNEEPCVAAAVFTSNYFKAAPVLYDMDLLERNGSRGHGVLINAGNANAVTGEQGLQDAAKMAHLMEQACGLPAHTIFVMSTGVIGHKLPMEKLERGVRLLAEMIKTEAGRRGDNAAQAIMTTDLTPKEAFVEIEIGGRPVSIAGMAKGSGMIHPNMATMLSVIVTDAVIEPKALQAALKQAVGVSFNRITVDGDTSTNDTVLLLASGQAGHSTIAPDMPEFNTFTAGLTRVCTELAKAIARDGEGATKLVEIRVRGASSEEEAEMAAKAVATSPLTKTALFGNDPNWGRALAAAGRSGARVNPARAALWLGKFQLVEQGEPLAFDAVAAHNWLAASKEITLEIDLGIGQAEATVWTCDLSYKYVEINAEYHT